ncbi:MAG: hypothetical protein ACRCSA_05070, partial [Morganella morganii]
VGGVTDTAVSNVTENNGVYTATLSGTKAGDAVITVTADGTAVSGLSAPVKLTWDDGTDLYTQVNPYGFSLGDGFPSTGFIGATFTIRAGGDEANNSLFDWTVDQSWVSVSGNGVVTMNSEPVSAKNTVTVTRTPKAGGAPRSYTFTVKGWGTNTTGGAGPFISIQGRCTDTGSRLVTQAEIARGVGVRTVGSLFSEWGDMSRYLVGFPFAKTWTSDISGSNHHYAVALYNGTVVSELDTNGGMFGVCWNSL